MTNHRNLFDVNKWTKAHIGKLNNLLRNEEWVELQMLNVKSNFTPSPGLRKRLQLTSDDESALRGSFVVCVRTRKTTYAIAWKTAHGVKTGFVLWNTGVRLEGTMVVHYYIDMLDIIKGENSWVKHYAICLDCGDDFSGRTQDEYDEQLRERQRCEYDEGRKI